MCQTHTKRMEQLKGNKTLNSVCIVKLGVAGNSTGVQMPRDDTTG